MFTDGHASSVHDHMTGHTRNLQMRHMVWFEITLLCESFPANVTHKRFIPCVDTHVILKEQFAIEALPAYLTVVLLFLVCRGQKLLHKFRCWKHKMFQCEKVLLLVSVQGFHITLSILGAVINVSKEDIDHTFYSEKLIILYRKRITVM